MTYKMFNRSIIIYIWQACKKLVYGMVYDQKYTFPYASIKTIRFSSDIMKLITLHYFM